MSVCAAGGVGGVDGAGAEVFGTGVDSCLDGAGCGWKGEERVPVVCRFLSTNP